MIQINTKRPDTRRLIYEVCRIQADFRSFLVDHFAHVGRQMSSGLTYDEQISNFLDRVTCDEILAKLREHVENLLKEGSLKEERYIGLLDEIEKVSQFSEPLLNQRVFKDEIPPKEKRNFLQWLLITCGILWLYDKICWLWSRVNEIRVEGGTIVIIGVGGGLCIFGIKGCVLIKPQQSSQPMPSMRSADPSDMIGVQTRRTVNFCLRGITILQEDGPTHSLPQGALNSDQVQRRQQLSAHLNSLLTMYAPMEVPESSNHEFAPHRANSQFSSYGRYNGRFSSEPAITACESDQSNRLPIHVELKWKRKTESSVRNCFPNQNCSDAKSFTISCEFSYSIADKKDEYRCPNKSFTILSNGVSFLKPPALPIQQEQQQLQPNTNPTDIEFSTILNQCRGAFSALALLAACKNP